jgi:hypothetical protein
VELPELIRVGPSKWTPTRDELEGHDSHRIDVGASVDAGDSVARSLAPLLRRHVSGCADNRAGLCQLGGLAVRCIGTQKPGDSEIQQLHLRSFTGQHHVLGLQIPVNDAGSMRRVEDTREWLQDAKGFETIVSAPLAESRSERHAGHELEYEVDGPVAGRSKVVDRHGVRVTELASCLAFADEASAPPEVLALVAAEHLERDHIAEQPMAGPIDGAHPTFAEHGFDLVDLVEQGADEDLRICDECLTIVVAEIDARLERRLALRALARSGGRLRVAWRGRGIGRIVRRSLLAARYRRLNLGRAGEQHLDFITNRSVSGASLGEHSIAIGLAGLERLEKEPLYASVTIRIHRPPIMRSFRRRHNCGSVSSCGRVGAPARR